MMCFQHKTSYMFAWVVETVISTASGFILFLVQLASPQSISVLKARAVNIKPILR